MGSARTPLEQAINEIRALNIDVEIVDCDDNKNWQWFELKCLDGENDVDQTEAISNVTKRNGFDFLRAEFDEGRLAFNRQKE